MLFFYLNFDRFRSFGYLLQFSGSKRSFWHGKKSGSEQFRTKINILKHVEQIKTMFGQGLGTSHLALPANLIKQNPSGNGNSSDTWNFREQRFARCFQPNCSFRSRKAIIPPQTSSTTSSRKPRDATTHSDHR